MIEKTGGISICKGQYVLEMSFSPHALYMWESGSSIADYGHEIKY
jgi:hypothetical protein